jgi:hypothetical protein
MPRPRGGHLGGGHPARGARRRRRNGRGLRGDRPLRDHVRGEDPPSGDRRHARGASAFSARGRHRQHPRLPGHRGRARAGGRGGRGLPGDGVPLRRHGLCARGETRRHSAPRGRALDRRRDPRRARARPRQIGHPSRHQAGEPVRHAEGRAEGARLRHRPAARDGGRALAGDDAHRNGHGHARVHGPRAGPGALGRCGRTHGSVGRGRDDVHAAHREIRAPGRDFERGDGARRDEPGALARARVAPGARGPRPPRGSRPRLRPSGALRHRREHARVCPRGAGRGP